MKINKIILKVEDGKDIEFIPENGVRVVLSKGVKRVGDDMGFGSYETNGLRSIIIMDVPEIISKHLEIPLDQISNILNKK